MFILRNGFVFTRHHRTVGKLSRAEYRPVLTAVFAVIVMILVPYSSASSGLGWAGTAESEYTMGTTVSYSPIGDVLASGHKNAILISDAVTQEVLQEFLVDFPILSLEFTSNASHLIIGMESELPNTPGTVVFERMINGDYTRTKHTEDGKDVDSISVSPDDTLFATATEDGSIAEWHIDRGTGSNLDMEIQYPSIHNGHINCIDHSHNGQHLLSGGDDGIVILWERSNQTEISRWETNDPIVDCSFSPDGSVMTWIGGASVYLRNYDQTFSYSGQFDISNSASQVEFVRESNTLAILVDEITSTPRHLEFINASTLPIQVERTLYLPHQSIQFALHPSMNHVAVATNSHYIAIYTDMVPHESEIPSSIDTDQDNVPDLIDDDDDGDGILDVYDNICSSGNNCHLKPDPEFMRNVRIELNGNDVVIRDTIHLDGQQSAFIRQLVADSISDPSRVDQAEYDDYLFSMCSEYSESEIKSRWMNHLQFENSTFIANSVTCKIDSGLYATRSSDSGTRISITWILTGVSTSTLIAPYNMSLLNGLLLPSSSIAQVVHTFPIRVEIDDISGMTHVEEIWDRRDAELEILVITPPESKPTEIESVIDIIVDYWYAVFFVIICIGSLAFTAIVRRTNRVDFSDLDTEDDEFDDDWEELVDDAAAWDEDMDISSKKKRHPKPPVAVKKDLKRKPKPPAAVMADLELQEENVTVRKVRKTSHSEPKSTNEGKVEFTHLISDSETVSADVTTTEEDEQMDDALTFITSEPEEESKKRRRVRRKKSND